MTNSNAIEFNGLGFSPALGEQQVAAWNALQQGLLEFMGRRAQACAKWPSDLARCHTPQDVWQEQMRFFQDMVSDCEASSKRFFVVFSPSSENAPISQAASSEQRS